MPATSSHKLRLPRDPDIFGGALAHIVIAKGDRDEVLGQAWIAAPNTLITCGHVVDQFVRSPGSLTVKFPASGNRYLIKEIKLHPSYSKHEDPQKKVDVVKFDVAALTVDLIEPESSARSLPIIYEKEVDQQQTLSAIRYPIHLGVYTTSLSPLAQIGNFLGHMSRNDRFHLLHDLALAPGDSGTALFDGESVVAIHCGDTATIPVLNVPATSIRMALSVDSLMALGVSETSNSEGPSLLNLIPAIMAFLVCGIITMAVFAFQYEGKWAFSTQQNFMLTVSFGKPPKEYNYGDALKMTITPKSECYIYVYYIDDTMALQVFPAPHQTAISAKRDASSNAVIESVGNQAIIVNNTPSGTFHILALKKDIPPVNENEQGDAETYQLPLSPTKLLDRINRLVKHNPGEVLHQEITAPQSGPPKS